MPADGKPLWTFRPRATEFGEPACSFLFALESIIQGDRNLQKAFRNERDLSTGRVTRLLFSQGIGRRASAVQKARELVPYMSTPMYRSVAQRVVDACRISGNTLQTCEHLANVAHPELGNRTLRDVFFPPYRAIANPFMPEEVFPYVFDTTTFKYKASNK